jgi:hypothetical protein
VLIVAHRILIGAAILFGLFFTVWEAPAYRPTGHVDNLLISVVAAAITLGLAYYLKNLRRFVGGVQSPPGR